MAADVWVSDAEWQWALADELRRTLPSSHPTLGADGCVLSDNLVSEAASTQRATPEPMIAFASQCLPAATAVEAASIADWARQAGGTISERLDAAESPWRLHVFAHPADAEGSPTRRAVLIRERIVADLLAGKRRLAKRLTTDDDAPWREGEALVQVLLTSPAAGHVSVCDAPTRIPVRRCVSRFTAGRVEPAVDKQAPSRAFAKLVEVERRLARPIGRGESCVDLGSSPGSWAYTALARGARVTAVDRSPLRDDLMRHHDLTFVRGDAFRFAPETPVDWLLSDVIAFPDRIGALLSEWLTNRRCRFFCVTIKFRGRDDDAELESVKQVLRTSGYEFALRRLTANKNEATAYGFLPGGADDPPSLA